MADDLKTMLIKVLHSKGRKRFFFAYGTGKRMDGAGDGHLIVGAKKAKKVEVQESCACQAFYEGHCWSSPDGEVVFFLSKAAKLSAASVAKMALTAKKLSKRQFDFQVPSPEEETRAESLEESQAESQTDTQSSEPESKAPQSNGADGVRELWRKRRAAIEPRLLAAFKEQRGDAARMRTVFASALAKASANEHGPALEELDVLDQLLSKAAADDGARNGHAAEFQTRLKTLLGEATKSGVKGQQLADVKLLVSEAQTLARRQEYGQAGAVLDRLADLLKTIAEAQQPGADSPFRKEWAAARVELRTAIEKVSDQLEEFASALLDDASDPGRRWIAEQGLGEILSSLRGSAAKIDRATSKEPAKLAAKAKPSIAELKDQLKSAQVKACDANQLGVRVAIAATIGKAVKRLEAALA